MTTLNLELKHVMLRHLQSADTPTILRIASELCAQENTAAIAAPAPVTALQPRFIKIGDAGEQLPDDATEWDAVLDTSTNLMWTRDNVGNDRVDWKQAKAAAEGVECVGLKGWRLPTIKELLSLVDYERHDPAIDTSVFPSCKPAWYWSASPYAYSPGFCAWLVYFSNGYSNWSDQSDGGFVRAVRASQ